MVQTTNKLMALIAAQFGKMLEHHNKTIPEESRGIMPSKKRARQISIDLRKSLAEYRKISIKETKENKNADGKKHHSTN